MKVSASFVILLLFTVSSYAQKDPVSEIKKHITQNEMQAHVAFLAADEMRGRNTGSPEIDIAANYIASYFRQIGLRELPRADRYFQSVELQAIIPPTTLELVVGGQTFRLKDDLGLMSGDEAEIQGDIVFAGYGSREDLQAANIRNKIVVTFAGASNENNVTKAIMSDAPEKRNIARELGAKALIEIVTHPGVPWGSIYGYLGSGRLSVKKDATSIPHVWMRNVDDQAITALKETKNATGSLRVIGNALKITPAKNVVGLIEGTDKVLKNEYIVVSAHYDHVGVGRKINQDSIYNGARDNALGTAGLMATARFLAMYPPKRSVIFIALTAEEKGLLGSAWYAEHPLVPLKQTVFNFNSDGAGYNDTTRTTTIGLERTSAANDITKASATFGLKAMPDPAPEQKLYERSDNYNFAVKGIPAIDFAPGTKAFDAELMKFYHQPSDEVSTLDFNYLIRFFHAYVYSTYLIANNPVTPSWVPGDKFEGAAKKLYGR